MWPLNDIIALSLRRTLTARSIISTVDKSDSLEDALVCLAMNNSLFDDANAMRSAATEIQLQCEAQCISIISYWDSTYPSGLRTLASPPVVLYAKGKLEMDSIPAIGVVGTRSCSVQYGVQVTTSFVRSWVQAGCCIVSGLASGIDSLAHRACLDNMGYTVAVVASGLDRILPTTAQSLSRDIVDAKGCIISEYPCGQPALPSFFPQRNRIISGLSQAVVVIESRNTGGALITAEFARSQNRLLFAVPGPVNSSRSAGTNMLIESGAARMALSPESILKAMNIAPQQKHVTEKVSERAILILEAISEHPSPPDAIASTTGLPTPDVFTELLDLELKGLVMCRSGKYERR